MAESESSQQPQLQQQQGVPVLLRSLKEQTPLSFLSSLLSITFDFVTGRSERVTRAAAPLNAAWRRHRVALRRESVC